jgi:DNA-binding transcriptional MerR regulator
MDTESGLTVGAIARLAGVTVRTLHHYDEIGLVSPDARSESGYRVYRELEIDRLQEVLFYRELGFGLEGIKKMVDAPGYARGNALGLQKELLLAKATRLLTMVDAIEEAIDAAQKGTKMTPEDRLEVFGDFDPTEHAEEAKARWGGTDAYAESERKVRGYTKQDWLRLQAEADSVNQDLLDLMGRGVAADSPEAMDLAEQHRAHITKWFYECTPDIHAGLGRMYVADRRFRNNIDKADEGLAEYLSAAITANHRRLADA